ncbi:PKS_ER domain-containing protein, partial [Haematococcus lacustris]
MASCSARQVALGRRSCTIRARMIACKSTTPTAALPTHSRRWVAQRIGHSFREVAELQEVPMEQLAPGPGEVLVHMHFAGVNGGCETFRVRAEHAFKSNLDKVQTRTTTAQQESSA